MKNAWIPHFWIGCNLTTARALRCCLRSGGAGRAGVELAQPNLIRTVRELMYLKMELRQGDKVLLSVKASIHAGFVDDVHERIKAPGRDSPDRHHRSHTRFGRSQSSRAAVGSWARGVRLHSRCSGQSLRLRRQSVQHCDNWREAAVELVRARRRTIMPKLAWTRRCGWRNDHGPARRILH